METLEKLKDYLKTSEKYNHAISLLYWDMETTMPKEGFEGHSDTLSFLSTENFKRGTSKELEGYLEELSNPENFEKLDATWKFIVKTMYEDIKRDQNIPVDFYQAYVEEQNIAGIAWQDAKKASDFSIFAPHLEKMIDMQKKMVGYTYPEKEAYDAMLGLYEKGMDSATYDRVFGELKEGLLPLLNKILNAKEPDDSKFNKEYCIDGEKKAEKFLLEYIGFSYDKGTTGETEHPFTLNISSKDVRVSNHFRTDNAIDPMFSAIHEGGHAIFEQNVNPDLNGTVAGSCHYLGLHESQSRFYENVLGRNINFWLPIYDKIQEMVPELKDITLDEFYKEINHVKNSYIRTMADEVTYCLHILVRYEIEKAIFRNNVPVSKLPALWNEKMEEYLHITPRDDAEGILQDMHWSDGSFGYFPTYLLGSIYDGMFLEAVEKDLGPVDEVLKAGKIKDITKWLNAHIHVYGSSRLPKEVIDTVCGKEVSSKPILKYFTEKYTKIYNL